MKPQFIEFSRDTMLPFSMYDGEYQYDVEYHRAGDQLYIDASGGGPPYLEGRFSYWWAVEGLHPDAIDPKTGNRYPAPLGHRIIELPKEYLDEDTGEPADVEAWAFHGRLVSCEVCKDRIPEEAPCGHLEWDGGEGDYVIRAEGIDDENLP